MGNREVEPPREVQRMSCRLAINSMGRRSTGSDDDEECDRAMEGMVGGEGGGHGRN